MSTYGVEGQGGGVSQRLCLSADGTWVACGHAAGAERRSCTERARGRLSPGAQCAVHGPTAARPAACAPCSRRNLPRSQRTRPRSRRPRSSSSRHLRHLGGRRVSPPASPHVLPLAVPPPVRSPPVPLAVPPSMPPVVPLVVPSARRRPPRPRPRHRRCACALRRAPRVQRVPQ